MRNSFLDCYIATLTAREKALRRFVDILARSGIVLLKQAVAFSGRAFWKKFPATDKVKRAFRKLLKDTGTRFGSTAPVV
jgi:hypothetical protein